jgi:outer membrane protein assembly factor BamB
MTNKILRGGAGYRLATILLLCSTGAFAENWPQWRGPQQNGVSGETGLPLRWSPEDNISWKLPMPERSGSTPIIWGERIFLSVGDGEELWLWCLDREAGEVVWKRPLGAGNRRQRKHTMSSPSPVTDGESVYVLTGTGVLKGFDLEGLELWSRDLPTDYGPFGLNWGYGSSPLLHDDSLYVQVLHGMKTDDPSYVLRIDKTTGETRWRVERPTDAIRESPDSYTTPALADVGDRIEIVITGGDCVTGHDPATGRELWRANGLNPTRNRSYRIVASPVMAAGLVIAPTRVKPLLALRPGGSGDVSSSHRVWSFDRGPDVPTPVSDGSHLYIVTDKGLVWCLDLGTGKPLYGPERLVTGTYSASPLLALAEGRIYVTSEDGVTSVFRTGPRFELLAENPLDGFTLSSPAVSDGQIFIRTAQYLYCIGPRAGR